MRREVNTVLDVVAGRLRNTRAVCRTSYVHPAVLDAFADGTLEARWHPAGTRRPRGLTTEEQSLLGFLRTADTTSRHAEPRAA
jgi:DNA topoisomerase-1